MTRPPGKCIRNRYGYYELAEKPTSDELAQYYSQKYYQESHSTYEEAYPEDEIKYLFNKIDQKFGLVKNLLGGNGPRSLLDVGCGEGFTLKYFDNMGWDITGVDFSTHGCLTHHPMYAGRIRTGEFGETLSRMTLEEDRHDLIWLDNVLEHVLLPGNLLELCRKLGKDRAYLMIEVPNDFSILQHGAMELGLIDNEFWVAVPDHISYFNKEGLCNLCREAGWELEVAIADFPIDLNLFNDSANYVRDRQKGKPAHWQRVRIENLLHQAPSDLVTRFYQAMLDVGLGRQIIALFRKA